MAITAFSACLTPLMESVLAAILGPLSALTAWLATSSLLACVHLAQTLGLFVGSALLWPAILA